MPDHIARSRFQNPLPYSTPFLYILLFLLTLSITSGSAQAKPAPESLPVGKRQEASLSVGDFFLMEDELPDPWIPEPGTYTPGMHMSVKEKLMGGDWWSVRIWDQALTKALHVTIGLFPTEAQAAKYSDPDTYIYLTDAYAESGETFTEVLNKENSQYTLSGGTAYGDGGFSGGYQHQKFQPFNVFRVGRVLIHTDASEPSGEGILEPLLVEKARRLQSAETTGDPMITPEVVSVTPETGGVIELLASVDGYEPAVQLIDNSDNFGSVDLSGQVSDLNSGAGIGGAVVEITAGGSYGQVQTGPDGRYFITVVVPGGQGSGEIGGIDFALQAAANLTVEIIPETTELIADGASTTNIAVQVRDLQGNPLADRAINLSLSADVGPGTLQTSQGTTDANGMIQATYTSFKPDSGVDINTTRHEVTLSARDSETGFEVSDAIYVNQYQLAVLSGEYIPACKNCGFPSEFTISVSDYWNNPIPNTLVTLQIQDGSSDGTLVVDPNSTQSQQEISLTTDGDGRAKVYYKWQGNPTVSEELQRVIVLENATNAQVIKDVKIHGLDIAIAKVEEAGFTGVTGHQAFLKIYFKELTHPDLPLERFNSEEPNKLGLRVAIQQYHSEGDGISTPYELTGGWEQDEGGTFVKMYATPFMPNIVPVNDGTSWYEIRIDPVQDQDVYLPDRFRPNNDTFFALTTGSPDGWLHIFLKDGVLTPHTWTGVIFKCVARFLPLLGDAITVIDTLNQAYNKDVLALSQSTATVLTENLQAFGKKNLLTQYKASTINNVVSCVQDAAMVYKEKNSQGAFKSVGICAKLIIPANAIAPLQEGDIEMVPVYMDRFVQGMLLDSPGERAVVVYGLGAGDVILRDAAENVFNDPDRMSVSDNMSVYILPIGEMYQLELTGDHDFNIGIYQPAESDDTRETIRQEVQSDSSLTAILPIGSSSDYVLEIDNNNDGSMDEVQNPTMTRMETVKPTITSFEPQADSIIKGAAKIQVDYADNPGGVGIDLQRVEIFVDGGNRTAEADVRMDGLTLVLPESETGAHTVRVGVSDMDGNGVETAWTFVAEPGIWGSFEGNITILLGVCLCSLLLVGALIVIAIFLYIRRRKTALAPVRAGDGQSVQDQQGDWWYQDPSTGSWYFWNGQIWQPVPAETPRVAPPIPSAPPKAPRRSGSCLFTLIAVTLVGLAVVGAISLVAFNFFPAYPFTPGPGDMDQILKLGGGGLLLTLLGIIMLNSGFRAVLTRRAVVEDDYGRHREKRGCSAVFNGLGQLFFGLLLLAGGLGLLTLAFYQEVMPWLGF